MTIQYLEPTQRNNPIQGEASVIFMEPLDIFVTLPFKWSGNIWELMWWHNIGTSCDAESVISGDNTARQMNIFSFWMFGYLQISGFGFLQILGFGDLDICIYWNLDLLGNTWHSEQRIDMQLQNISEDILCPLIIWLCEHLKVWIYLDIWN